MVDELYPNEVSGVEEVDEVGKEDTALVDEFEEAESVQPDADVASADVEEAEWAEDFDADSGIEEEELPADQGKDDSEGNALAPGAQRELSDEELDQVADTAIAALEDILKYFDLGEVTIDEYEGDEGELILDITGDDLAVLIGRHGKTLDALQFVISSITARKMGFRYPVVVDVEGYKGRQRQKIENLAFATAKRALSQGRSAKMRPMTPYERRLVHIALRGFDGVSTASEGEGSARHVVVIPD